MLWKHCFAGVRNNEAGGLVKGHEQVAEHVAGAAVVMMRNPAFVIGGVMALVVTRITWRRNVIGMRCLTRGCLPTEGRRKHRRQQNGEQCRGDGFQDATHGAGFYRIGARCQHPFRRPAGNPARRAR